TRTSRCTAAGTTASTCPAPSCAPPPGCSGPAAPWSWSTPRCRPRPCARRRRARAPSSTSGPSRTSADGTGWCSHGAPTPERDGEAPAQPDAHDVGDDVPRVARPSGQHRVLHHLAHHGVGDRDHPLHPEPRPQGHRDDQCEHRDVPDLVRTRHAHRTRARHLRRVQHREVDEERDDEEDASVERGHGRQGCHPRRGTRGRIPLVSVYDCTQAETRDEGVAAAATALSRGRLVVLPTDTVYGIGASAFDPAAVAALLAAKGRGRQSPPPVLVPAPATVAGLATEVPDAVHALVEAFWPGPLTIICRAQPTLAWDLGDTGGTVALRMPDDEVALALLTKTGPLAVSSANRHGGPAATTVLEAATALGEIGRAHV